MKTPPRDGRSLADRINARFAALGGLELPEIPREPMRQSPILTNDRRLRVRTRGPLRARPPIVEFLLHEK